MHGIIQANDELEVADNERKRRASSVFGRLLSKYRNLSFFVILPTLLVAGYYYLIASNQYESSADFIVRRSDATVQGSAGVGQLLGFDFGTTSTQSEAYIIQEYLLSHDTVRRLREEDRLVDRFRPTGTDWISRLWYAQPTPEKLLSYYRGKVVIEQDTESGITHLRVRAFTPEDSYHIARKLLRLGEERINALNERTYRDQVSSSKLELVEAERSLESAQANLTLFRRQHQDIDPEGSGSAQIGLVTGLTGELVAARARLQAMSSVISPSSPQYRALAGQIAAMEHQVAGQSDRIAGQGPSIASSLGDFEELVIKREHASKRYAASAAQYEQARAEAARKKLYLIRIVDANRPVKSLFPERGRIVLSVLASLLVAYLIGSLLIAGIREHHL